MPCPDARRRIIDSELEDPSSQLLPRLLPVLSEYKLLVALCIETRKGTASRSHGYYQRRTPIHAPADVGTMTPSVSYHCLCLSADPVPPPPDAPSSSYGFHPLHELFFCEGCDAVCCNRCVSVKVSGYYCPNYLFEVPSASVRAEKNRCAYIQTKGRYCSP